jgi:hypothetical protein
MFDEQRQKNRNGCSDAALAASSAGDSPEFAHALQWRRSTAGNGGKDLSLIGVKRQGEGSAEHGEPSLPRRQIAECSSK